MKLDAKKLKLKTKKGALKLLFNKLSK